jgi:hypothetical protein
MDPHINPFAPGAGTPPPELAGREELVVNADIAFARLKAGRPARSLMITGLRGVGKTVLLNTLEAAAVEQGYATASIEAHAGKPLISLLYPSLRRILMTVDRAAAARDYSRRALRVMRGFAAAFKLSAGGVDIGIEAESGADSGDLELDLPELLSVIAQAARASGKPVGLFIDELQYVKPAELSALIMAMHKVAQLQLPLALVAAGLPTLLALAGDSKSYAERLFDYPEAGPLTDTAARDAIAIPAAREHVAFRPGALDEIVVQTKGYPYFIQEWGKHAWNLAAKSPVTRADVVAAGPVAIRHLDKMFFRVRYDRLTPRERNYLRAMAEFGPGLHRSGEIATMMQMSVNQAAPLRNGLIKKGMIYSPAHGDTAFTVPMFDDFMRRTVPVFSLDGSDED